MSGKQKKKAAVKTKSVSLSVKLKSVIREKMPPIDTKRLLMLNIPYVIVFYLVDKEAWLYRYCIGESLADKAMALFLNFQLAFENPIPSIHGYDLLAGVIGAVIVKIIVYMKGKNAKKYRHGEEYGSARWGTPKDIAPFIDPVFENNILLTQTERLTMNSRPKLPKYARNKNVIIIGGSGQFLQYSGGQKNMHVKIEDLCRYEMGPTSTANIWYARECAERGFDGIIHIKSAACTPEIDVMPVLQNISADYKIPVLYLTYDAQTSDVGLMTRLEAFYDMIDMRKKVL